MTLVLQAKITQPVSPKSFRFTDLTGQYSSLNTGGWGAPNEVIANAEAATLTISKRNDDGTYGTAVVVDVFPDLPSDSGAVKDITGEDFTGVANSSFLDGIYKVVYTVSRTTATPFTYTLEKIVPFTANIDACYKVQTADNATGCGCSDDEFKALALQVRLMCGAITCSKLDTIQDYIDRITNMCENLDCACS